MPSFPQLIFDTTWDHQCRYIMCRAFPPYYSMWLFIKSRLLWQQLRCEMLMTCAPVTLRSPVKWIKCFWFHLNQSKEANHHRVTTHDGSLHSCVNTQQNDEQCVYKYFYSGWFRPWTHRGWAPAAVAHFSWCWRSEHHGEEQAVETKEKFRPTETKSFKGSIFQSFFCFLIGETLK